MEVTLHVSVWVEIRSNNSAFASIMSRSTWACELKFDDLNGMTTEQQSRSTWACELKCARICGALHRWRHAPRERVSWNYHFCKHYHILVGHAPRERVSWNALADFATGWIKGHAPRERVSWNASHTDTGIISDVTLHVSVWVEMSPEVVIYTIVSSRSTWACELKSQIQNYRLPANLSRSTWACELKFSICRVTEWQWRHAPRERVSWNFILVRFFGQYISHAPRERVSWNAVVGQGVHNCKASRSTWACELKCSIQAVPVCS